MTEKERQAGENRNTLSALGLNPRQVEFVRELYEAGGSVATMTEGNTATRSTLYKRMKKLGLRTKRKDRIRMLLAELGRRAKGVGTRSTCVNRDVVIEAGLRYLRAENDDYLAHLFALVSVSQRLKVLKSGKVEEGEVNES